MSWQDILKETIAQNRVKEIEDIDIDIDDDDCIRWVKKLYSILEREPTAFRGRMDDLSEEEACKIKEVGEDKKGLRFLNFETELYRVGRAVKRALNISPSLQEKAVVTFRLLYYKVDNTFECELYCSTKQPTKILYVDVNELSQEKAIRITKELCNYLNISYDKLTEGVF